MKELSTIKFDLGASQVVLVVKNPPADAGDVRDAGLILGLEDPLEEGVASHSSILAWRVPWTKEPEGLHTVHRVAKNQTQLKQLSTARAYYRCFASMNMY